MKIFLIDGEITPHSNVLMANKEAFTHEDIRALDRLKIGEVLNFGTGETITRLDPSETRGPTPVNKCGHSSCSQHFIDTGDTRCLDPDKGKQP